MRWPFFVKDQRTPQYSFLTVKGLFRLEEKVERVEEGSERIEKEVEKDGKTIEKLVKIIERKAGISEKVEIVFTGIMEMLARGENGGTNQKEIFANGGSRSARAE